MEFISQTFEKDVFKTATERRLWKVYTTKGGGSSFRSVHFPKSSSCQQKTSKNKMLKQIGISTNDIYQ